MVNFSYLSSRILGCPYKEHGERRRKELGFRKYARRNVMFLKIDPKIPFPWNISRERERGILIFGEICFYEYMTKYHDSSINSKFVEKER